MSAGTLSRLKAADAEKIENRARVIYARKHSMPLAIMPQGTQRKFEARAAVELWDENALNFQPDTDTNEVCS